MANSIVINQPKNCCAVICRAASNTKHDASRVLKTETKIVQAVFKSVRAYVRVPVLREIVAAIPSFVLSAVFALVTISLGSFFLLFDFLRHALCRDCGLDCTVDVTEVEESDDDGLDEAVRKAATIVLPTEVPFD